MTAPAKKLINEKFTQIESEVVPVGDTITLESIDANRTHCFCGIQFFSDAAGEIPVTPTAGFILIKIQTLNTYPVWEIIPDNVIDADKPVTVGWDANTRTVKATPDDVATIVGATHYKLVVTCNGT